VRRKVCVATCKSWSSTPALRRRETRKMRAWCGLGCRVASSH
jgi:hypothetical protein